jgi:glutamyl-tRNA reductase
MRISLVGIDHQTAPVAIREKVAISATKLDGVLPVLGSFISRGIILSTCNRTEVYTIDSDQRNAERASLDFLRARLGISDAALLKHVYLLEDRTAVEHLFRVASGLESMIVGEFEVLGQVGHALGAAEGAGMVSLPLRHIFQSAVRTGRRVREETGISRNALSVSSVAVDLASGVIGDLKKGKMLVIGAGEAGRLVAKAARDRGISQMVVVGRTQPRASALAAQLGGMPVTPDSVDEELLTTDIVVSCAGAPHRILSVGQVKRAMEKRPTLPLAIIDIAVPRNVEPAVSRIKNVFLYNIDDLTGLSVLNRKQREDEIEKASQIIAEELDKFSLWWQEFRVRPLIRAMMSRAEEIRRSHFKRTVKKLPRLTEEEQYSLEMMTKAIISKLLKDPVNYLKTNGSKNYAEMIKEIFRLEEGEE